MASLRPYKSVEKWILHWGWTLNGKRYRIKKESSWKNPSDRKRPPPALQQQYLDVQVVEQHVKSKVVPPGGVEEIERWVARKYIDEKRACGVWPGYKSTTALRGKATRIDWAAIKTGFEDHYLKPLKPGGKARDPNRKSFRNHMSQYQYIERWLKKNHPTLHPSDTELRDWQESLLAKGESASTVNKRRSALAVVFRVAVAANMIELNPLDANNNPAIKTLVEIRNRPRRPVSPVEAKASVERINKKLDLYSNPFKTVNLRQYPMSGCLPIALFQGLYMGLRNEEVRWSTWDAIDYERGIYYVQRTTCQLTGEVWTPKDAEMREIKVIGRMMEWFKWERQRQQGLVVYFNKEDRLPPGKIVGEVKIPSPLGQFIIPSGTYYRTDLRGRPVGETALRRSFDEFVQNEVDLFRLPLPTFYSGRHTYATENARAGMKVRDLQARMGHSDIRTTMKYVEAVRAEESTIEEDLPY